MVSPCAGESYHSPLYSVCAAAIVANGETLLLSRLINLAVPPPGVRFKQSAMPFVQMENISLFLRACQSPPLNLQEHDMFLTVDLYEQKDPAQVLQCLGAFSRAANSVNPSDFPTAIGGRPGRGGVLSPQSTGSITPMRTGNDPLRGRGISNASNASSAYSRATPTRATPTLVASKTGDSGSGRWSPTKSPTKSPTHNGSGSPVGISSWSKKELEGSTAPAWNINQYGYMGGASQGNLGISFGGRRQITSAGPYVPNMAEKERRRKIAEAEAEQQRLQAEEEERQRKAELEAEEERARLEEERRWEEETRRAREEERRRAEEEKRRWEEEERQWKITEERRRREEEAAEARLEQERQRSRSKSDARLRGQYLSQYKAEQRLSPQRTGGDGEYSSRVKELEKELELARQREAEYERERQDRGHRREQTPADKDKKARARSRSRPAVARPPSRQDSWRTKDERDFARAQPDQDHGQGPASSGWSQPAPAPARSPRPLPDPTAAAPPSPTKVKSHRTAGDGPPIIPVRKHHTGSRPLPDPTAYASTPPPQQAAPPMSRTDRYLASNPAPSPRAAQQTYSRELDGTAERDAEDRRRMAAQQHTKAGGFASKSLLEREMEMERQRQREWEDAQKETAKAPRPADGRVDGIGGGVGGRWDVSQWSGYTRGDGQNRGAQGIGAGRRQIVGPRPLPGTR